MDITGLPVWFRIGHQHRGIVFDPAELGKMGLGPRLVHPLPVAGQLVFQRLGFPRFWWRIWLGQLCGWRWRTHGLGTQPGSSVRCALSAKLRGTTQSGVYAASWSVSSVHSNPGFSNGVSSRSAEGWQGFGRRTEPRAISNEPRSVPGAGYTYRPPQVSSPHYMATNPQTQHYSEPRYSNPKYSAPKYSAPKFSTPKAPHFSAPKNSGGRRSGKSSHKH
jgi:hypothetical protein